VISDPELKGILAPILRKHRGQQGLSNPQIASRVGYVISGRKTSSTSSGVDDLMAGKSDPSLTILFRLCRVLGPDFVDDVYKTMFEWAKKGLEDKRDDHLRQARRIGLEIRDRQIKDRPA
jgi:transcriptional regulator with XRE-family HTH domain